MKIAVFSDTHLGFDEKGERYSESFENLGQAIKIALQGEADFCVLCGDIFDAPVPSHNVLYRAIESFSLAKSGSSAASFVLEKNSEKKALQISGLPLITIHGNHEFRGKETKTALDVLNLSGLIVYLHAGKIIAEKGNERVCVFGLGAVPEKRALDVLHHWNPVPEKGACNLLLLHQTFKEFIVIDDEMVATLSLDDLPSGFDLIVNGHLHWANEQKLRETTFLLAGSTIATSIKKLECEKPKGVFFFDSASKELSFTPFPRQRKMFYHRVLLDSASQENVLGDCRSAIESDLREKQEMKPLIRINLKGTLKKGLSSADIDLKEITEAYSGRAFLSVSKNFLADSFRKKISELRELQKSRLSIAAMGFDILEKNLKETDFGGAFDLKEIFDLLAEDELEKALEKVSHS
ncbi:MAG: metallophosphoesterase [archaeon]